jgi:hypothetical protein
VCGVIYCIELNQNLDTLFYSILLYSILITIYRFTCVKEGEREREGERKREREREKGEREKGEKDREKGEKDREKG